jgi:hypothetical protein
MKKKYRTQIVKQNMDETKLSWEETYKQIAQEDEDWQDFENTISDGWETVMPRSPTFSWQIQNNFDSDTKSRGS